MISRYRAMWVYAMFDAPVKTDVQRRSANRFRNHLKELGFSMEQLSVYLKFESSRESAIALADKVATYIPKNGNVSILFVTDKQYKMIRSYYGKCEVDKPEPPSLFNFL